MSTKPIKSTNWARRFKQTCPTGYREAIKIAERIKSGEITEVCIYRNNENGKWVWSIIPSGEFVSRVDQGFWLDSKPTQKEAIGVCREMGWKYHISREAIYA